MRGARAPPPSRHPQDHDAGLRTSGGATPLGAGGSGRRSCEISYPGLTRLNLGGRIALTTGQSLRRALGQNALQGAAMHIEPACRLGAVAAAKFVHALNVLPPHTITPHPTLP